MCLRGIVAFAMRGDRSCACACGAGGYGARRLVGVGVCATWQVCMRYGRRSGARQTGREAGGQHARHPHWVCTGVISGLGVGLCRGRPPSTTACDAAPSRKARMAWRVVDTHGSHTLFMIYVTLTHTPSRHETRQHTSAERDPRCGGCGVWTRPAGHSRQRFAHTWRAWRTVCVGSLPPGPLSTWITIL
eukprot:6938248-Prymnesium_polylepis.1